MIQPHNDEPQTYEQQVEGALLHMEYYGGAVCNLLNEEPVVAGYIRDQPVLNTLIDFFASEGWLLSGTGYFSAVFIRGDLALKVGLKKEDTGATYAAWCRAHQGYEGVPVIHRIEKFLNCYLVMTNRYNSVTDQLLSPQMRGERRHLRKVLEDGVEPHTEVYAARTAAMIRQFFEGIATFDLNTGNLMVDRRGEFVITDPVSFDHADGGYAGSSYSRGSASYYTG